MSIPSPFRRAGLALALVLTAATCAAQRQMFPENPPQGASWYGLTPGFDYGVTIPNQFGTFNLTAVELYMTSSSALGAAEVSIWSVDPVTQMPSTQITRTQFTTYGPFEGYHGAVFSQPVTLPASTPFVVALSGDYGLSLGHSGPASLPLLRSFAGGPWFPAANIGTPSIRLYQGYHAGTVRYYGTGKPGSQSVTPWLSHRGFPVTRNEIALDVTDAPATAPCVFMLGTSTQITLPIGTLYVQPIASVAATTVGGSTTMPLTIPYSPALAGVRLAAQAVLLDPGASFGVSHTQGLEVTIGH